MDMFHLPGRLTVYHFQCTDTEPRLFVNKHYGGICRKIKNRVSHKFDGTVLRSLHVQLGLLSRIWGYSLFPWLLIYSGDSAHPRANISGGQSS